jgi:hypothetical protein
MPCYVKCPSGSNTSLTFTLEVLSHIWSFADVGVRAKALRNMDGARGYLVGRGLCGSVNADEAVIGSLFQSLGVCRPRRWG